MEQNFFLQKDEETSFNNDSPFKLWQKRTSHETISTWRHNAKFIISISALKHYLFRLSFHVGNSGWWALYVRLSKCHFHCLSIAATLTRRLEYACAVPAWKHNFVTSAKPIYLHQVSPWNSLPKTIPDYYQVRPFLLLIITDRYSKLISVLRTTKFL